MNTSRPDFYQRIPVLLTLMGNRLTSGASALYRRRFGIGIVEWRILAHLAVEQNISINRLREVLGLDKGEASRYAKVLQRRRLIKVRPNAGDARLLNLTMTAAGRRLHARIDKISNERHRRFLQDLNAREIDQLTRLLSRLNDRIPTVNAYEPQA